MLNNHHIAVIIPALNEAHAIGRVIAELPDCVDDIIVVDNGSTDDTAGVARAAGARVVRENRRGYGAACLAGIQAAGETDLLAFIDGDYSDYPAELARVIAPVAAGTMDLCLGIRRDGADKPAMPWHQRFGNWLLCRVIGVVHGYCYQDFGPMRCISRRWLERLAMRDMNYGWTVEMQLKADRAGARVGQIEVGYRQRVGESKISGTVRGSVFAASKMLFWIFRLALEPKSKPAR